MDLNLKIPVKNSKANVISITESVMSKIFIYLFEISHNVSVYIMSRYIHILSFFNSRSEIWESVDPRNPPDILCYTPRRAQPDARLYLAQCGTKHSGVNEKNMSRSHYRINFSG